MIEVGSYCCAAVESPFPSSKTICSWVADAFRFFGFGIGVMNSARRRLSSKRPVGCPLSSSSQCWRGYSYGEFWVWAAVVLWGLGMGLGGRGGRKQEEVRRLAQRLAGEGDAPSAELRARAREPIPTAMSWGAGVAFLLVLVLMIWKPGA